MNPPRISINLNTFWEDPYPTLSSMRASTPICEVPELNAVLFTRRDDIFTCEKNIDVFSSDQPQGLMTTLMGRNMMRKDGDAHTSERRQMFPSVSPRTIVGTWKQRFTDGCQQVLDSIATRQTIDLVQDYALPVSGYALCQLTGLTNFSAIDIDQVSQAMIDGVGNYAGDPELESRCTAATAKIDTAIDEMIPHWLEDPEPNILHTLIQSGQSMQSVRANVKLAISGGQNEPRDAIAGTAYALIKQPEQLDKIHNGDATWLNAFEEYARWNSPIGMSPRELKTDFQWNGIDLVKGTRIFFMFGSANHDEEHFIEPEKFDITRNTNKAISFGAGPHFCAGAAASRVLISEVALPTLFERYPDIQLDGPVRFGGWAFRGPLQVPVRLC